MVSTAALWSELTARNRAMSRLNDIRSVLAWDEQTGLPRGASATRGEQSAILASLVHDRYREERHGELLMQLAERDDLEAVQRAGLRNLERQWRRAVAVPSELVERLTRLQSEGFHAWMTAREHRDFARFVPMLTEIVDATRERAAAIDSSRPAYDVLLDEYEPGMTTAALVPLFERLRVGLVELLDAIRGATPLPELPGTFDRDRQLSLHRTVARALGYDFRCGRLDLSEHPFTISLGAGDVRITTRVSDDDLLAGLGGTVHETGHALYEQGLPPDLGCGIEAAASMGLHESQSRFWENTIGRSLPFFKWLQGPLTEQFGASVPDPIALYHAANRVAPGLIRVSADECTYNLHVIVRFRLERALMDGTLSVPDLREAWIEAYRSDLGVTPTDDTVGVLQDVHWSGGAIGYFPSYTLGNLYAASLGKTLEEELPDLWDRVECGDFSPILAWLRERVHRHGHRWDAPELVRAVTGDRDPIEDLLSYLWSRHGALHGVRR